MEGLLRVVPATQGLQSIGTPEDEYYSPRNNEETRKLRDFLACLPDGACLGVRGRDFERGSSLSEWDYGVGVKNASRLFFIYKSGDIESLPISVINYKELVHFCRAISTPCTSLSTTPTDRVVMINHGWSEDVGPDYPLIRALESSAMQRGWKTIVPDFRPSYKYGDARGRSERVRVIYEELLCLYPKPSKLVLAGHSQGGACSSLACTDRIVNSMNIQGLLLLGSESPLTLDGMDWVPIIPNCMIVHAQKDSVISISEMRKVATDWKVPLHELDSTVKRGVKDCWGDDVHHDFLAKDLLNAVVALFGKFLDNCR